MKKKRFSLLKKNLFFSLDYDVVNAVTKWKKTFFCLDHGVVNRVIKWKKTFFSLDHSVVKVFTNWKFFSSWSWQSPHISMHNMTLKLLKTLMWDWEGSSKFGLLTFMTHIINRKHIFLYPECDINGMSKPKKEKYQH